MIAAHFPDSVLPVTDNCTMDCSCQMGDSCAGDFHIGTGYGRTPFRLSSLSGSADSVFRKSACYRPEDPVLMSSL